MKLMRSRTGKYVKCLIICIIGLQLICITYFINFLNQCATTTTGTTINAVNYHQKHSLHSNQQKPFHPHNNNYIKLENYRAHLNTDPNQIHFGEINEHSLTGIILSISNRNDNDLQTYSTLCDSMIQCIGFSTHPSIGILFHNHTSFPLQYVRNWNFYIKDKEENKKYEMTQFTNKRINYTMNVVSSSNIPSLSALGLPYSVPIIPRKFMSFEWNLGRTNNQLYSFEAMLQHSVIYLRTLILPFTTHRNHDIGMLANQSLSLWDMVKLSEFVDFIFEHEITLNSVPDMTEYVITGNNDIIANTFDIKLSADDVKWKQYFDQQENDIIHEPNYNLLSLLQYRMFTNNEKWTLSHENLIHNNWEQNEWKCYVSRGIRDKIPHDTLSYCRSIHFCLGRYAHFKLDDWPIFDVLHFMIPSQRIRSAVENTIKFWFEQDKHYRIGVHRRAMKEGGTDSTGTPYVCRYKSKSVSKSGRYAGLRRHIESFLGNKFKNSKETADRKTKATTDLYDRTCAIDFETIQQVLKFHKQKPLAETVFWNNKIKSYKERKQNIEPWFLACDNQEPEVLNEFIDKHGAVTLNGLSLADFWNGPLYWNQAKEMEMQQRSYTQIVEKQYLKYLKLYQDDKELNREYKKWIKQLVDKHQQQWWYDCSKIEFWRKEIVVFDMWMLRKSQFFVGSWHSTLTRNVCHWRGYENMYNSTNCYLVHKWRAMYDNNFKPPIDNAFAYDWFDIDAVDKPLLTWEDAK